MKALQDIINRDMMVNEDDYVFTFSGVLYVSIRQSFFLSSITLLEP